MRNHYLMTLGNLAPGLTTAQSAGAHLGTATSSFTNDVNRDTNVSSMPNANPQRDLQRLEDQQQKEINQLIQKTAPTDGLTRMLFIAGTTVGAYHGYKRNNSVGWAVAWGLLGGIVPIITVPVALAQGLGQPKED